MGENKFKLTPLEQRDIDILVVAHSRSTMVPKNHHSVRRAVEYDHHVTGAGMIVAMNGARFGLRTRFATGVVTEDDRSIFIEGNVRASGVDLRRIPFEQTGNGEPHHALLFSTKPTGHVGPKVTYLGADEREVGGMVTPAHFTNTPGCSFDELFGNGAGVYVVDGTFVTLSESAREVTLALVNEAKRRGALIFADLNWRLKLWKRWGGEKAAQAFWKTLLPLLDGLIGNEEDLQHCLGVVGPDVEKTGGALDTAGFRALIGEVLKQYPHLALVATSLRDVVQTGHHRFSGILFHNGEFYQGPVKDIEDIDDRVGGGDAFFSALLKAILAGMSPQDAINCAVASGTLKLGYPQVDQEATWSEVLAAAADKSKRTDR